MTSTEPPPSSRYDLYYLKHRSLVLDLAIVLMTSRILVTGSGAR